MPLARRAEVLDAAAAAIRAETEKLATLDCLSTGKAISGAIAYDLYEAQNAFAHAAAVVRDMHGDVRKASYPPTLLPGGGPDILNLRLREPAGVVAEMVPWNGPIFTGSERIAAALAAGCSIVAKPSEESPCSLTVLAHLLHDAGIPDGVFNVVLGRGETVGERLVTDPRVDVISLTGSVDTGQRVLALAAPQFKQVNLELGGKAPVIVFADADLDQAVSWAMMAAFVNMGEVCVAGSRLLVEAPVYSDVVAGVAAAAGSLPIGDALDPQTFIGPLVNVAHADRVRSFVDRAITNGDAAHENEPTLPDGLTNAYVAPTVLRDVKAGSEIEQHEVFGPVLGSQAFTAEEDAVALANSTRYGLSATVFTRDINRAFRLADQLDVGDVDVNCHFVPNVNAGRGMPRRRSGMSAVGVASYERPKGVNISLG
jgi:acyl-CoA reductase-like NAD-dependent aldehyde dehydrogenase